MTTNVIYSEMAPTDSVPVHRATVSIDTVPANAHPEGVIITLKMPEGAFVSVAASHAWQKAPDAKRLTYTVAYQGGTDYELSFYATA